MLKPKTIQVYVPKSNIRKFVNQGKSEIITHLYPSLRYWVAGIVPDNNNPRSHEELRGKIPKAIRDTLEYEPTMFRLKNRGALIIADSSTWDQEREIYSFTLSNYLAEDGNGPPDHGLADGGTTDLVIQRFQTEIAQNNGFGSFKDMLKSNEPDLDFGTLAEAEIHLEVVVGISGNIDGICEARNTSQQVKQFSMADFKGEYDWLKEILEKQRYGKNIAYNEGEKNPVSILEVLRILNLFHPRYTNEAQPIESYARKGKMVEFLREEVIGFKRLKFIIPDILRLHDYVWSTYHKKSKVRSISQYKSKDKDERAFSPYTTPKPGSFSEFKITNKLDRGLLYPLLASLRSLTDLSSDEIGWKINPHEFWDEHSPMLFNELVEFWSKSYNRNPNVVGKSRSVYASLYNAARAVLLT